MEFRVLGPIAAVSNGRPVDLGPRKRRMVLAVLLLEANRVVPVGRLVELVWDGDAPASAPRILQAHVSRLRSALGAAGASADGVALVRRGPGYLLSCDPARVDAFRFRTLVDAARAHRDAAERARLLREALALWQGPPLADAAPEEARARLCAGLEEARLTAIEDLLGAELDLGRHVTAADELTDLVRRYPQRQRLVGQLMLALHRAGRSSEALAAYRRARRLLAEESGLDPSPELQRLQLAILRADPGLDPVATGAAATEEPARSVVPAQLPPTVVDFTGRDLELTWLDALTADGGTTAVVIGAIDGTAGVGKTALAVQWAHQMAARFPDGQLYANLRGFAAAAQPLRPVEVLAGFLHALGVPPEQTPAGVDEAAATYRSMLAGKRVLVVLDNAASAAQVRPLLPGSPTCLVVVTSRDRLAGLVASNGARRLTLEVLSPAEAVALLAKTVGSDRVAAEPEAAARLARLCGHLPLALRIAAANVGGRPYRTVVEYVNELAAGNRLAALAVDGDEQVAVRAAFELSYIRLEPAARAMFRLLGLVPGPDVTAAAAAALGWVGLADARRLLDRLADAHLIVQSGPDRSALHDLLRLFAQSCVSAEDDGAAAEAAVGRLYDWYLHAVEAAAEFAYPHMLRLPAPPPPPGLPPPGFDGHAAALAWLDAERPNLVAAVAAAVPGGPAAAAAGDRAWRLAHAMRGYFHLRRYGVDWLTTATAGLAAAAVADDPRAPVAGHIGLADAHWTLGDYSNAVEHYTAALALDPDGDWPNGRIAALGNLGIVYFSQGQTERGADCYRRALDGARRVGPGPYLLMLGNLGIAYQDMGRLEEAAAMQTQALALARETGSRFGEAMSLDNLGSAQRDLGRLDNALDSLTRALALHRDGGDRNGEAVVLDDLAAVHRDAGRLADAVDLAATAVALARDIGDRRAEAQALNTLGATYCRLGSPGAAVESHGRALFLARETGDHSPEVAALIGLAAAQHAGGSDDLAVDLCQEALDGARWAGLRVLECRAHAVLAAAFAGSDPAAAAEHARRALALHRDTGCHLDAADAAALARMASAAAVAGA